MKYTYYQGLIKERISKLALLTIALLFALTAAIGVMQSSMAATQSELLDPFTQDELDDNWGADRTFPSGGVESVSFAGRNDVAAIGVVGTEQSSLGSFYYYEGIKKVSNFGDEVSIDLYVPEEWENAETSPLNVGMWASDSPLSAYPLIVFRNGADVDAGFYTYDYEFDENGVFVGAKYVPASVAVDYGEWNTLSIVRDAENESFVYMINNQEAGRMDEVFGSIGDYIEQVYLNHYNNGDLDYTAHWHTGFPSPVEKNECKKGAWGSFGFRNQGQCVRFVNTGQDSR